MRHRILTVDDSKTVRIIVKKAFKLHDCEILEAANGVDGLALAASARPDLILLDVTMPTMDGVEMLSRLKSDPALKTIPVVMLTAEGGRDNVLKIAKIGVRDYIVKPFKEDVLLQKVGRIIDLAPLADAPVRHRTIHDPATLLVVDDKPAIVQQIQTGLRHTPWQVTGVATTADALDTCARTPPDLVIISLSLPDDAAYTLFRVIRNTPRTKHTPIFGLVVKTDTAAQQQAQQLGFTALATKPLDMRDVEARIARALNLDTSHRYFSIDQDHLLIRLPQDTSSQTTINELTQHLKSKIADAVDTGAARALIDLSQVPHLDLPLIKLLLQTMETCAALGLQYALVGNPAIQSQCHDFEDTRDWRFHPTLDAARASTAPQPQPVPAT
ncbi:response regulator [Geminisphaera colitermitum]|uniref:response regulator n=1 Tax=Geminisphaera colitermitum TaxID=1148786 RepID=UPI000694ACD0|nr:response regulator [Geminisphaera colitermitum]